MLNLNNITFNQRQQRSDTEVLRNAQRFIPANRWRQVYEQILYKIEIMKYGDYNVIEKIGNGGFGEVYKVEKDGINYALKICKETDTEDIKRFKREVRLMEAVNQENVISILDSNLENEPPFFVMPLCETSLENKDYDGHVEILISDVLQICDGLEALHNNDNPIIHRDIKPSNILIHNGVLKLSDLGLGRFENRDSTTITKFPLGTHGFAPPEFYHGDGMKNAKKNSDIFQLGKTIYSLFTKENPSYLNKNKIPGGLYYIIKKCTADKPEERYQSIAELRNALSAHLDVLSNKNNPYSTFDNTLETFMKSKATKDKATKLFSILYEFKEDSNEFYSKVNKIPIGYFGLLSDSDLQTFLDVYCDVTADLNDNGNLGFSDAETIASQMKKVFSSTGNSEIRVKALRTTLIFAANYNRYAAMDTFNEMLTEIKEKEEAQSVASMLYENIEEYEDIVTQRHQSSNIHDIIKVVRHKILNKK
mgnify:FL=1